MTDKNSEHKQRLDGSFLKALYDLTEKLDSELLNIGTVIEGTATIHDDVDREHKVQVRYDDDCGHYVIL
jgi:hypothetical protein